VTFEMLILRRPLSVQANNRQLQQWKVFVRSEAAKVWTEAAIQTGDLHVTIVYLCGLTPPDVDNIIKPIQDALRGLVYADDAIVADVESHRRSIAGTFDLTRLPELLLSGIASQTECVYLKVRRSRSLEDYL
jgi:crossover junction endodeoxyribonuclease RusA